MAELVWHGKKNNEHHPSPLEEPKGEISASPLHHLIISERYPAEDLPSQQENWHNRLIWGNKDAVLSALLHEFRASIDLIYIDPPFMTGRTFSSGNQVAYHDTWRNDLDKYLNWLYETFLLLYDLLALDGSIYIHLDWRTTHYARIMLDEIFGTSLRSNGPGFKNEIIWHYQSGGRAQKFYARKHDTLLWYTRSGQYCFHPERISQRRGTNRRNHMRKEQDPDGRIYWTIRSSGRTYRYHEDTLMSPPDVWSDISHLHQRDPERTGYATQKPEALIERIIQASSEEGDLVLDCFCGSGVTPIVAQRLGRRWIAADKSELAITMTRERLLAQTQTPPFLVQHCIEVK